MFKLITSYSLHEDANLTIRLFNLLFVILIFILISNHFFEAIIFHLFIVQDQVLDLQLQVMFFMTPGFTLFFYQIMQLLCLIIAHSFLSLQFFLLCHQISFWGHQMSQLLLQMLVVFLKRIKFNLLWLQSLWLLLEISWDFFFFVHQSFFFF